MLRGSQSAMVDAKGRVKIPVIFILELKKAGDDFYVTSETGSFARLFPMKIWEEIEQKVAKLPSYNPTKQKFLRRTSYYGQEAKIDAQGRILIHPRLRESADLTGQVEVVGNQTGLEVWNHSRFYEQEVRAHPWTEEDAKTLGDLGI